MLFPSLDRRGPRPPYGPFKIGPFKVPSWFAVGYWGTWFVGGIIIELVVLLR